MAVNIKNDRVERLINEVAALTGESKTEAVRRALEERRDRLARHPAVPTAAARIRLVLEREVWPSVPPHLLGRHLSKAEEEAVLGYGADGT